MWTLLVFGGNKHNEEPDRWIRLREGVTDVFDETFLHSLSPHFLIPLLYLLQSFFLSLSLYLSFCLSTRHLCTVNLATLSLVWPWPVLNTTLFWNKHRLLFWEMIDFLPPHSLTSHKWHQLHPRLSISPMTLSASICLIVSVYNNLSHLSIILLSTGAALFQVLWP